MELWKWNGILFKENDKTYAYPVVFLCETKFYNKMFDFLHKKYFEIQQRAKAN